MTAKVVMNGLESDPFMVNTGIKQDCVLAPVIFNLFLVAITLAFRHGVTMEDAVEAVICSTSADSKQRQRGTLGMCLNSSMQS